MHIVRKAVAYITRNGRVLFFRAREAREETGFTEFGVPRLLGVVEYDPCDGKEEMHERYFFELPLLVDAPARWDRLVEQGNGLFTFSFFWVDGTNVPKKVYRGHDVFLTNVLRRLLTSRLRRFSLRITPLWSSVSC